MNKHQKIDWNSIDWSKNDAQIGRDVGCSRQNIQRYRKWLEAGSPAPKQRGRPKFVLPSGFKPGESAGFDANRFGVCTATMTAAYRRSGIPVKGVGRLSRK